MKRIIVLCLVVVSYCSYAQTKDFSFHYQVGVGSFEMGDLKVLMSDLAEELPFNAKLLDPYPPYVYNQVAFLHRIYNNFYLGFKARHTSTGARVSYADYSASFAIDNSLIANTVGLVTVIDIYKSNRFNLSIIGGLSSNRSRVVFHEYSSVGGTHLKTTLNSASTSGEFGFNVSKIFFERYSLALNFEYLASSNGDIKEGDNYSIYNRDKVVTTNWSGFRFGLSIGFHI
jgi:hypothetical protein